MKKLIKTLVLTLIPLSFLISCKSTKATNNNFTPTGDFFYDNRLSEEQNFLPNNYKYSTIRAF